MGTIDEYKEKIYKAAAINKDVKLNPFQQRVVNSPSNNAIIAHEVGAGKTLAGIAKFEHMKEQGKASKALIVVPAGLRDNFAKEGVKKFTNSKANIIGNKQEISSKIYKSIDPKADYNVISYEMFRSNPEKYIKESGADTIITDEGHKVKNEGTMTTDAFKKVRHLYKNHITLTGSLISNTPADLQPLVDIATGGEHNLGKNKEEFEKNWLIRNNRGPYKNISQKRRPVMSIRNKKKLQEELNKYIDYADFDDVKDLAQMPEKHISEIKVPLSKDQVKIYKGLLNNNPKVKKLISMKRLETMKADEQASAFNKLIEARKLMNSIGAVVPGINLSDSANMTPKTKKLLDDVENHLKTTPDGQAIAFSHLINGGIDVMEAGAKDRKIPYGRFIGKGNIGVTESSRQRDAENYKKGKNKLMLISGAGAEGISLGNTTFEGVLDPHYNPERMKQMEARGIRSHGLSQRPKEQRIVQVNRYLSTMPKTLGIFKSSLKTPDEFIYEISKNKEKQNKLLYDLLKDQNRNKGKKKSFFNSKTASYEDAVCKEASRAWKRNFSEGIRPKLEQSGVLNHEKELSGLNKGSDEIIRKKNITVTHHQNPQDLTKEFYERIKDNNIMKTQIDPSAAAGMAAQNGAFGRYFVGMANDRGNHMLNLGDLTNAPAFKGKMSKVKDSLHNRYMEGIVKRHEVDEIREGIKQFENPKKHLKRDGSKIILGSTDGGHNTPKVLGRESANIAYSPG
jgi:hypothetical protein